MSTYDDWIAKFHRDKGYHPLGDVIFEAGVAEGLCRVAPASVSDAGGPIYQLRMASGDYRDIAKNSYDYNVKHGHAHACRILYAAPTQSTQQPASKISDAEMRIREEGRIEEINAVEAAQQPDAGEPVPVEMGHGLVAVGTCTRSTDGAPGLIYLSIPGGSRSHGEDCADIYPVGEAAPTGSVLACIYFLTAETVQQSIDVLRKVQATHYAAPVPAPQVAQQQDGDFQNFHRSLCERFGYMHDPIYWKRDQVSLIEYIAKKITPQPDGGDPAEPRDDSDRTYSKPIGYLPAYELDRLHSGHDANLRSAKFGPSALDGDVPVYLDAPKVAPCQTCGGHGMIGGPSFSAPDEGGEPCPDCAPHVAQGDEPSNISPLSDFYEGQWWVNELDALASSGAATADQKRAVATVHHMLRSAAIALNATATGAQEDDDPVTFAKAIVELRQADRMNAARYLAWRDALCFENEQFLSAIMMALGKAKGDAPPTPKQLDEAFDSVIDAARNGEKS